MALIFEPTNETLGTYPKLGIYTDYYGMNYWQDSLGFVAVLGASATFLIGLIFSIIFDIKPQKRIKHKLLKDFRNIDRYGLDKEDEDLEEELVRKEHEDLAKYAPRKGKAPIHPDEELKNELDDDLVKPKDKTTA